MASAELLIGSRVVLQHEISGGFLCSDYEAPPHIATSATAGCVFELSVPAGAPGTPRRHKLAACSGALAATRASRAAAALPRRRSRAAA